MDARASSLYYYHPRRRRAALAGTDAASSHQPRPSEQHLCTPPLDPPSTQSAPFQAHPLPKGLPFSPGVSPNALSPFLLSSIAFPPGHSLHFPPFHLSCIVASTARQSGSPRGIALPPSLILRDARPPVFPSRPRSQILYPPSLQLALRCCTPKPQIHRLFPRDTPVQQPWLPRSAESSSSSVTVPAARPVC